MDTPAPPASTAPAPTPTTTDAAKKTSDDTTNSTSPSSSSASASATSISPDELISLIQAIKFAKADASQRQVWKEISQELSGKPGFAFLSQVALNDVKKVWKKALKTASDAPASSDKQTAAAATTDQPTNKTDKNNDTPPAAAAPKTDTLKSKLMEAGSKPSIFTVGQLAQEYTAMTIAEASAGEQEAINAMMEGYVHVFLDVPADRSGNKPHQALISFQKKQQTTPSSSSLSTGKSSKGNKKGEPATTTTTIEEIVKIQRAAPMHANDTTCHPMLAYNQSKTRKTFVHPDSDPEGYQTIVSLIGRAGKQGALAHLGGTKAYFYALVTPLKKGSSSSSSLSVIWSIQTTELAPPQAW